MQKPDIYNPVFANYYAESSDAIFSWHYQNLSNMSYFLFIVWEISHYFLRINLGWLPVDNYTNRADLWPCQSQLLQACCLNDDYDNNPGDFIMNMIFFRTFLMLSSDKKEVKLLFIISQ